MDQSAAPTNGTRTRARTQQACESCRALKARCVASEQPGICRRCSTTGKRCTFAACQPRPKRPRASNKQLAEMEKKLDGLVTLLAQPPSAPQIRARFAHDRQPSAPAESTVGSSTASASPASSSTREGYRVESSGPGSLADPMADTYARLTSPKTSPGKLEDGFAKDLMDLADAQRLLSSFREMTDVFPFVVIPPGVTAETMNHERPFLLLAIAAAASSTNRPLQIALEKELLHILSKNVLVEGKKSLDLLQGTLVYLAWYHFHFHPQTQQIYQLLQLAIGMTIDLGFHEKPRKPMVDLSHYSRSNHNSAPGQAYHSGEARRALLGCYYLSSAVTAVIGKPNLLAYTDYMTRCAVSLADEMAVPSDAWLMHAIRLQHIAEQINEAFHSEASEQLLTGEYLRLQMYIKTFRSQLEEWRSSVGLDTFASSKLSYYFIKIQLHDIGLRMDKLDSPQAHIQTTAHLTHFDLLTSCLEASKVYFDHLISLSPSQYRRLSFVEWTRVPYAIVVLSKLAFSVRKVPSWDLQAVRETVPLGLYLELLCYRMQNMTSSTVEAPQQPDFFQSLRALFEQTRGWYERKVRSEDGRVGEDDEIGDDVSPLEVIKDPHDVNATSEASSNATPGGDGYDERGETKPGGSSNALAMAVPDEDEFWASMLADWPRLPGEEYQFLPLSSA